MDYIKIGKQVFLTTLVTIFLVAGIFLVIGILISHFFPDKRIIIIVISMAISYPCAQVTLYYVLKKMVIKKTGIDIFGSDLGKNIFIRLFFVIKDRLLKSRK